MISPGVVQMDPGKVKAVTGWAVPSSRRELQRFLGFANFYRKFVRNYSSVAAPLTSLTSTKVRFLWNKDAESAFSTLKTMFTTAPVLAIPNPSSQFIVEVDASGTGVGAVLSQRLARDNRVHPCAYFSRRLSTSEQNYGIGDRELLAIRLALEEWRHWLEGTETPFLIWTDHRNLEYLKTAKRLNSRQARCSLFFLDLISALLQTGLKERQARCSLQTVCPGVSRRSRDYPPPPTALWLPHNCMWRPMSNGPWHKTLVRGTVLLVNFLCFSVSVLRCFSGATAHFWPATLGSLGPSPT